MKYLVVWSLRVYQSAGTGKALEESESGEMACTLPEEIGAKSDSVLVRNAATWNVAGSGISGHKRVEKMAVGSTWVSVDGSGGRLVAREGEVRWA